MLWIRPADGTAQSWRPAYTAEGSGYRLAELWVGHIQALLDLGLAGDFFPESLVPQGSQSALDFPSSCARKLEMRS